MGIRRVSETNLGVYVWKLSNGNYLMDDDFNVLSIASMRGDLRRMTQLRQAAISYGFPDGEPEFVEGASKINDEEFEYQRDRFLAGLVPDPYDIGSFKDDIKKS